VLPLLMAVVFGAFATALALSFFQPMVSLVEPMMNMRFRP
jgi:hypothetical protein